MELTKAQRIMVEDGLPAELLLTQEQRTAAWEPDTGVTWTHSFKDPATESQREIHEQFKREATARRIQKLLARKARKAAAVKPATIRGQRWDSRRNKWVPINPTESRMKDDIKSESAASATTDTDTQKPVASNEGTMTNTTKAKKARAKKPAKAKAAKGKKVAKTAKKAAKGSNGVKKHTPREGNKTQDVLAKMRTAKGVTRAEILEMTGWKAVSVQQLVKAQGLNPDKDLKISEERPFSYRLAK